MYKIKKEIKFTNQRKAADEIGIAQETLSRILNGKQKCTKMTAYCIVKYLGSKNEVNDYFEKKDRKENE